MLLSEGFSRRHECPLTAALDGAEERVERDDRLARADVSLQEPLHRDGAREVTVDLPDRLLLVRRERERQGLAVAMDEVAGLGERRGKRPLALGRAPRDPDLEDEQLLEGEPLPSRFGLAEVAWPVHRRERVPLQRQALALAQLGWKRIGEVRRERKCSVHHAPHRRGRDLLRGGIDRSVGAGLEAEAAELAAEADLGSRLQPIGEPGLVEPGDADRGRVVGDPRNDPRPAPPAHRALLDVEDTAADDHLLTLAEGGDRHLVGSRLVPPRPVLEHVPHGREPELPELPPGRRGDAGERVESELESLRPQSARRRRPGPGLVQACKDRLSTGGCHRPRHRADGSIPLGPDVRVANAGDGGLRLWQRRPPRREAPARRR